MIPTEVLPDRPCFDMVSTGSTCQLSTSLSSVIAVLDASGNLLSEQRYPSTVLRASLPFGQVRDDVGTIDETDFGYTSQRALDAQNTAYSLGLMDYRARFFSPLLGRFLQPDTLVPGAGNPQAFNRYSYGFNNPSRFSDPSGHLGKDNVVCTDDGECNNQKVSTSTKLWTQYGVKLKGNVSSRDQTAILLAVQAVANKFAQTTGSHDEASAFRNEYGITTDRPLIILNGTSGVDSLSPGCTRIGIGACTSNARLINYVELAIHSENNIVHELGHAFSWANGGEPSTQLETDMGTNELLKRSADEDQYFGFGSTYNSSPLEWQMSVNPPDNPHYVESGSEVFADMFLGWVYNTWYNGNLPRELSRKNERIDWMADHMPGWLP